MSSPVEDKDDRPRTDVAEAGGSTSTPKQTKSVAFKDTQTQSEFEPVAECSTSQFNSQESFPGILSDPHPSQRANECCIVIPESVSAGSNPDRLMIIETKDLVHGILKPPEFNFNSQQTAERVGNDDVSVNLSNFLTYARRNNCVMIPTSRGCCYPRYVYSEHQNFPRPFNTATSYHPNEFIGVTNASSRNSVLMPHLYSGPDDIRPPLVDFSAPPPYDTPFKLPTYEDVQREKELEVDNSPIDRLRLSESQQPEPLTSSRPLSFLTVDGETAAAADNESKLLGTDFMFAISFLLALVFNWIGFLLLLCFCHTVAARYGALSGFGLSLAKWTIIVKQTAVTPLHNVWLWWLIMIFGLLICVRSLLQYIHIKRGWRLMTATMQERLLVYY